MKVLISTMSLCALLSTSALAQSSGSGKSDQQFVDFAAQTDMTEAHVGEVAGNQGASQGVKDFGQMLVTDHTKDYQQLTMIAGKAGFTVPKGLDAMHDKMIAPLEKMKGAAFDRRFAHEMVTGHQKAIAEYKKEAENGQSAEIKAYATQALPVLEKHLSTAQDLTPGKHKMSK